MAVNRANVLRSVELVGGKHTRCIVRLAVKADALENRWMTESRKFHQQIMGKIEKDIRAGRRPSFEIEAFEQFVLSHYMETWGVARDSVETEMQEIVPEKRLAKKPTSLKTIKELYDRYRTTGYLPKALKKRAVDIQKNYLKKVQAAWGKYSEDFRTGDEYTQEAVLRKVQKSADVARSRAQTIVRTSTTNYYNETRREIYDQSDAIWGYLFLAIRDQGTTKWCSDKVTQGKRGRHGLVYKKGEPLTIKERPACHWNCRSEFVPLTSYNPRHLILIENKRLHRVNVTCHPLPHGWSASA